MASSFKVSRLLPTRAPGSPARTLATAAILTCAVGFGMPPVQAAERLASVSTITGSSTLARAVLPERKRASQARRIASIALRSLRFRSALPPLAALGDFSHVRLADRTGVSRTARSGPAVSGSEAARGRPASPAPDDFIVMIDPGHGGRDQGAKAFNGLLEKDLTRDIGEQVRRFLSEIDGITVLTTRHGDEGLSRQKRVDRIRASQADLVLSLHFNHLPQQEVTLVESYYAAAANIAESQQMRSEAGTVPAAASAGIDTSFTEGSARLAGLVQDRVYGEVARNNSAALDAGVKRETLFVLTRSFVPGALVELTCLSNPAEAERLVDPAYRTALAAALADAVRDYRRSVRERPLGEVGA